MSVQEAPVRSTSVAHERTVADPSSDQGGSPDEGIDQAGGEGEDTTGDELSQDEGLEQTVEEGDTEGQETQTSRSSAGPTAAELAAEEIADLKSRLAASDEIIGEVRARMDADPVLREKLGAQGTNTSSARAVTEKTIRERFQPEAASAMNELITPLLERIEYLESEQRQMKPVVGSLAQTVGTSEFVSALVENGVTHEVMKSRPFQKHLQTLRNDPRFKRIEAQSREFAGEHAALKWIASRARNVSNMDERARIGTARTMRNTSTPSGGAATSTKVVQITRSGVDGHIQEAHKLRIQYAKAGKPMPKIEYINPK